MVRYFLICFLTTNDAANVDTEPVAAWPILQWNEVSSTQGALVCGCMAECEGQWQSYS